MTHPESRTIRVAEARDGEACAAVYAPYVRDTAITFETEAPTAEGMGARITEHGRTHAWIVIEGPAGVIGFAYAHPFASRAAYAWSCESSVYVTPEARRSGAGRLLYADLLRRVADRGYRRVFAGVTLPNPASLGLHRSFGFELTGTFRRVGWKLGAWHDVARLQLDLGDVDPLAPPAPTR